MNDKIFATERIEIQTNFYENKDSNIKFPMLIAVEHIVSGIAEDNTTKELYKVKISAVQSNLYQENIVTKFKNELLQNNSNQTRKLPVHRAVLMGNLSVIASKLYLNKLAKALLPLCAMNNMQDKDFKEAQILVSQVKRNIWKLKLIIGLSMLYMIATTLIIMVLWK